MTPEQLHRRIDELSRFKVQVLLAVLIARERDALERALKVVDELTAPAAGE